MSRLFGTDGVRGIANTELTAELAYNLGRAGAYVLTEGTHKPKILVAKDTRISGDMLEVAFSCRYIISWSRGSMLRSSSNTSGSSFNKSIWSRRWSYDISFTQSS